MDYKSYLTAEAKRELSSGAPFRRVLVYIKIKCAHSLPPDKLEMNFEKGELEKIHLDNIKNNNMKYFNKIK